MVFIYEKYYLLKKCLVSHKLIKIILENFHMIIHKINYKNIGENNTDWLDKLIN